MRRRYRNVEVLEERRYLAGDSVAAIVTPSGISSELGTTPGIVPRIVGGTNTSTTEHPWMASLSSPGFGHFCGGSLISPTIVVTAAHCVDTESTTSFRVILGRTALSSTAGEVFSVSAIHLHPNFSTTTFSGDVAVIELSRASSAVPLALMTPALEPTFAAPGTLAESTGWGETATSFVSDILQVATVPILANATANQPDYHFGLVRDDMIAAGYPEGGIDTCYGDSGGPMTVAGEHGERLLTGITSWGAGGCAAAKKPGVYARVSTYSNWISSFIPSRTARLMTDASLYNGDELLKLQLVDLDLAPDAKPVVTVESPAGELEHLVLSSTGVDGYFSGQVQLKRSTPQRDNGQLEVATGESLLATFLDETNQEGNRTEVHATIQIVADDHGNSASSATAVAMGSSTRGTIESTRDVDWFAVSIVAGKTYQFSVELTGTLTDANLRLIGTNGASTIALGDPFALYPLITWTAPATGVYYLEVGSSFDQGTYNFVARELVDDFGNNAATAKKVAVGESTPGHIDVLDDVDWFAVELHRGDVIDVNVNLGTLTDSYLNLYSKDGVSLLMFDDDSGPGNASHLTWLAKYTGTYYLEVGAYSFDPGSYTVQAILRNIDRRFDDHGGGKNDATLVEPGLSQRGIVDYAGDDDWFAFQVTAGRAVTVVANLADPFTAELTVFAPNGETVVRENASQTPQMAASVRFTPTSNGIYFARVTGQRFEDLGGYNLRVSSASLLDVFEPNDSPSSATSLSSSGGRWEDLSIHNAVDVDWFRWLATQEGTMYVDVSFDDTVGDLDLAVYDASGKLLAQGNHLNGLEQIAQTVQFAKLYYIRVIGWGSTANTYSLQIIAPQPAIADRFEPNDSRERAVRLDVGDQFQPQLSLHSSNDVDWFQWTALDDGTLEITLDNLTSSVPISVTVLGPNGSVAGSAASKLRISVVAGMTYELRIDQASHLSISNYSLRLVGPSAQVGDFNLDGFVDALDAGILFFQFGGQGTTDLNHDGIVDAADASILFGNWSPL